MSKRYAIWKKLVDSCANEHQTPFYLFSSAPLKQAIASLPKEASGIPIRNFYSFKTTPVAPVVKEWISSGNRIEVVSEFEYRSAFKLGAKPSDILVNGPRKSSWFKRIKPGSRVHFDSESEAYDFCNMASLARQCNIGLRIAVKEMRDPDDEHYTGQFGMASDSIKRVLDLCLSKAATIDSVHFHLRSNVPNIDSYIRSILEISQLCKSLKWFPRYLDIGGGAPALGEVPRTGDKSNWTVAELANAIGPVVKNSMDWVQEIWMENGRSVTESCAVLVTRVDDIKTNGGCRYVICDGGKVNQALVSDWDRHDIMFLPERDGDDVPTSICGPTCMAWDWIERKGLPNSISIGDLVIWLDAGAYHVPFETSFSHPLSSILWVDVNDRCTVVRKRQTFADWFQNIGGGYVSNEECGL